MKYFKAKILPACAILLVWVGESVKEMKNLRKRWIFKLNSEKRAWLAENIFDKLDGKFSQTYIIKLHGDTVKICFAFPFYWSANV